LITSDGGEPTVESRPLPFWSVCGKFWPRNN
jgi:hypothetical protein